MTVLVRAANGQLGSDHGSKKVFYVLSHWASLHTLRLYHQ